MTGPLPTVPSFDGPRRRSRLRLALMGLLLLSVGLLAWSLLAVGRDTGPVMKSLPSLTGNAGASAPDGVRIRVRVLNATGRRGLARRATLLLRDQGFDVVEYDSERNVALDRTEIVQYRGDADWSVRLERALGVGRRVSRPDSLVDVELTVRLGRDWEPPTEPLRP